VTSYRWHLAGIGAKEFQNIGIGVVVSRQTPTYQFPFTTSDHTAYTPTVPRIIQIDLLYFLHIRVLSHHHLGAVFFLFVMCFSPPFVVFSFFFFYSLNLFQAVIDTTFAFCDIHPYIHPPMSIHPIYIHTRSATYIYLSSIHASSS